MASNKQILKEIQKVNDYQVINIMRAVPRGLCWNGNYIVWVKAKKNSDEPEVRYYKKKIFKNGNHTWVKGKISELYC